MRARFITVIPAQDMVYLEKAAEARRYLAAYPTPEDEPAELDAGPTLGFPFIAPRSASPGPQPSPWRKVYVFGAALFRQAGAAIEQVRLGAVAAIETADNPAAISAAEASCHRGARPHPASLTTDTSMLNLGTPDDFRGNPYLGRLTNQMSHLLLGIVAAWLLGLFGASAWLCIAVVTIGAVALEAFHLSRGGSTTDSFNDIGFIVLGAAWQANGGGVLVALIAGICLAVGTANRAAERGEER